MYLCQWAWQWIKFSTDCICLVDNLQQLEQATRTHAHIDSMTPGWKPCGLLTACSHGQERLDANCRVYLLDTSLSSSCTKPVGFFKLHWRLPKSDVMQFNICRLAASCWNNQLYIKNVLPNNSPQACWQLAGDFLSSSRSKRSEHILIPRAWWVRGNEPAADTAATCAFMAVWTVQCWNARLKHHLLHCPL